MTSFSRVSNKFPENTIPSIKITGFIKGTNTDKEEHYARGELFAVPENSEGGDFKRIGSKSRVTIIRVADLPEKPVGAVGNDDEWEESSLEIMKDISPEAKEAMNQLLNPDIPGKRNWIDCINLLASVNAVARVRDTMTGTPVEGGEFPVGGDPAELKKMVIEKFEAEASQEGRGERLLSFLFPSLRPVGGGAPEAGVDVMNAVSDIGGWTKAEVKEPSFRIGAHGRTSAGNFLKGIAPFTEGIASVWSTISGESALDSVKEEMIAQVNRVKAAPVFADLKTKDDNGSLEIEDHNTSRQFEQAVQYNVLSNQRSLDTEKMVQAILRSSSDEELMSDSDFLSIASSLRDIQLRGANELVSVETTRTAAGEIGESRIRQLAAIAHFIHKKSKMFEQQPYENFANTNYGSLIDKDKISNAIIGDMNKALNFETVFGVEYDEEGQLIGEENPVIFCTREYFAIMKPSQIKDRLAATKAAKDATEEAKQAILADFGEHEVGRITQGGQKYNISTALKNSDMISSIEIPEEAVKTQMLDKLPDASMPTVPELQQSGYVRKLVRQVLIKEELTRTDKNEIERISRRQAKKYFDQQISKSIEAEIGRSFLGTRGKINKHVDNAITDRFKKSKNDKDFDEAVIRVCRRVLKALTDMHYKRTNLIDQMPIPKS